MTKAEQTWKLPTRRRWKDGRNPLITRGSEPPKFQQRGHSLYAPQHTVRAAGEAEQRTIKLVEFAGFPEITDKLEDYHLLFVASLKTHIGASETLADAVATAILNLFTHVPEEYRIVKPGINYDRSQREYNSRQLSLYLESIPCLESVPSSDSEITLGNFRQKQRYERENLAELISSKQLEGEFHLAYLHDPMSSDRKIRKMQSQILNGVVSHIIQGGIVLANPLERYSLRSLKYACSFGEIDLYRRI